MDAMQFFSPFLAAGLGAGISAAVAIKIATRNFANTLNVQSDKHRKDLEREAINAKRTRETTRLMQLAEEYSYYFTLVYFTTHEFYNIASNQGRIGANAVERFKGKSFEEFMEMDRRRRKIEFLDFDPNRRELISTTKLRLSTKSQEGIFDVKPLREMMNRILEVEQQVRGSLQSELQALL